MLASDDDDTLNGLSFSLASDIVELVVLTADDIFLLTLREAVGSARRLWHVPSGDKVSDLLVAGQVGILVLDAQALQEAPAVFVGQIKRQFPDLVVVVAGARDAEMALAPLISSGIVYRFIHKPMSPGRAKSFADAAVKKFSEQRRRAVAAPAQVTAPRVPRAWWVGGAVGLVALVIAVVGLLRGNSPDDDGLPPPAPSKTVTAESALLTRAGVAEVHERLLARAENALLEERLDEASAAIDAARRAGVESGRIAFLTAQLANSRERLSAAQAQLRARTERTGQQRITSLLDLAAQRMSAGQVIEPKGDSAQFYIQQALQFDPNNDAVQDAERALSLRLLNEIHAAIDRRDFDHASLWLDAARGIASPANIEAAENLLATARRQATADAAAQLLKNFNDRLQQDRLIDPANDSAKYYLLTLRGVDPGYAGLGPALSDLGSRLTAKARRALSLEQYDAAHSWLEQAAAIGYASNESSAVQQDLEAAIAKQK